MHPFIKGESYDREEILTFLSSKQWQSGIVYGAKNPHFIAIFTGGRYGKRAGYEDGWEPEGTFRYYGQGSKGDHKLEGANKILAAHPDLVLLFETWKPKHSWKGRQRFIGEYSVLGYDWSTGHGPRSGDNLLVYSLVPTHYFSPPVEIGTPTKGIVDINSARAEALKAGRLSTGTHLSLAQYRARSAIIARYVLMRANSQCEACGKPSPFSRPDGTPYLEVHHTRRLADEGPDDIMHVAGVCPNCHREAHFGSEMDRFRENIEKSIATRERQLEKGY